MTSLSDAYQQNAREVSSLERLYAGTALVLAGAALAVLALVVATTDLFGAFLTDKYAARELAGILGGLAVPAVLVGVFTVLPSNRRVRAAAAISASICLLGVALFHYAYPAHWDGYGQDLTLFVSGVYLVGLFSAIWCLFTAIVNFKTRNDPGGALNMNVTRKGETKIVEVDRSGGLGGVGLLGATPDGEVETQTNRSAVGPSATSTPTGATLGPRSGAAPASDGGSTTADISSPLDGGEGPPGDGRDAEFLSSERPGPSEPADRYCGNCGHFEYVRSSSGIAPYCGLHGEQMDDMDACEEWAPNRG